MTRYRRHRSHTHRMEQYSPVIHQIVTSHVHSLCSTAAQIYKTISLNNPERSYQLVYQPTSQSHCSRKSCFRPCYDCGCGSCASSCVRGRGCCRQDCLGTSHRPQQKTQHTMSHDAKSCGGTSRGGTSRGASHGYHATCASCASSCLLSCSMH
jgi:hypothetical protein